MNLKDIYFFKEATQVEDSKILINENKGDLLSMQVICEGTFSFTVQGCMDIESDIYEDVAATNMDTLNSNSTITEAGLYHLDIGGYRKVKLVLGSIGSSPLTVYGIMKDRLEEINEGGSGDLSNYYTKQQTNTLLSAKANTTDIPDLTDYVKNTDYASNSKGGVIKGGHGISINPSTGVLSVEVKNYADYQVQDNYTIIGKGTLENVITGKDLTTKAYVDGLVGDIDAALDLINGENVGDE